jgi:hypothetical protein
MGKRDKPRIVLRLSQINEFEISKASGSSREKCHPDWLSGKKDFDISGPGPGRANQSGRLGAVNG